MSHVLVIISDRQYATKIYEVIKDFEAVSGRILYVSLNKTLKSIESQFHRQRIPLSKFFFIDTISASLVPPERRPNCLFLPSASDLQLLYQEITKRMKMFDLVIFDSLSSLATYSDLPILQQFTVSLIKAADTIGVSTLFTCLQSDDGTKLITHVRPLVNNVIYIAE